MQYEFDIQSVDELGEVAEQIVELCKSNRLFVVDGEMGAGKTTLIAEVCKRLEIEDEPSSPTYSIVNTYYSPTHGKINHFDFYRLQDETEAMESGLDELLYSDAINFLEWSEKIANLLPQNYVRVTIKTAGDNRRTIKITV